MNGDADTLTLDEYGLPQVPAAAPASVLPPEAGAPLRASLPPGYGLTYSTPGPSDWTSPRTVTLPGGVPVSVPSNAQGLAVGYSQPPSPEDQMWTEMQRRFGGLPVEEARRNIGAAMRFMAVRQYQQAGGTPEAFAKAMQSVAMAQSLEGAAPNFGQVGTFMRATQPRPNFRFVPGTGGQPATFQSPGERPVVVPRSALPVADTLALQKQVVAPGITAYWHPQRGGVHIVKDNGEQLSDKDKAMLLTRVPGLLKDLADMDPNSPGYQESKQIVDTVRGMAGGAATAAKAPVGAPADRKKGEIERMTSDGRRAVFDSKTRKFLRYAE